MDLSGAEGLALVFKALSETNRLRILALLRNGALCVCDIESVLGLRQSNLSRHLTVLKGAGLVSSIRKATFVYYYLSNHGHPAFDLTKFLENLKGDPWDADQESLRCCARCNPQTS